jgi:hypothetical protein
MSDQHEQPHIDYCRRDTEIITLTLDMKVVKGQMDTVLQKLTVMEHALVGDMATDRSGLIVEHKEHHHTLFGKDNKEPGLVGDMKWVKKKLNESKAFANGMAAAFGFVGALFGLLGWKGVAAISEKLK